MSRVSTPPPPTPNALAAGTLTVAEASDRDRLQTEIADYQSNVAAIQHEQQLIEHDLAALPEKYSLSTHNDTLAQTRAFYEILAEDPFLKIKVGAIFLPLFLVDVTPTLIKLTVRTRYDRLGHAVDRYIADGIHEASQSQPCTKSFNPLSPALLAGRTVYEVIHSKLFSA